MLSTTAYITSPLIEQGLIYGFRYRARNTYGWGLWSLVTYELAASVPDAPPAPVYKAASDNSITVTLAFTEQSNGAVFDEHELWMAEGDDGTNDFALVTSYITIS